MLVDSSSFTLVTLLNSIDIVILFFNPCHNDANTYSFSSILNKDFQTDFKHFANYLDFFTTEGAMFHVILLLFTNGNLNTLFGGAF